MNTRDLTANEQANLEVIKGAGLPTVLLFVTPTGLKKSILDATLPMRTLLADAGVHDFGVQAQGPKNKRIVIGKILLNDRIEEAGVSLYRPLTKKGDPRLWPSNFSRFANSGDVFVVIAVNRQLCLVNLTQSNISEAVKLSIRTPTTEYIDKVRRKACSAAVELLGRFRELAARGPLLAIGQGDMSIGLTIETALGIKRNSSRKPDYKGIEIKAKRWALGRPEIDILYLHVFRIGF